jgi:hypothetical protein
MNGQKGFQLAPAILEPEQLGSQLLTATVVAKEIAPALFAFEEGDRRKRRLSINTDSGYVNPVR